MDISTLSPLSKVWLSLPQIPLAYLPCSKCSVFNSIVTLLVKGLPTFYIRRFTHSVQNSLALGHVVTNTMQSETSHTTDESK